MCITLFPLLHKPHLRKIDGHPGHVYDEKTGRTISMPPKYNKKKRPNLQAQGRAFRERRSVSSTGSYTSLMGRENRTRDGIDTDDPRAARQAAGATRPNSRPVPRTSRRDSSSS
ncbi:hypothetical protein P280DRAFT_482563 [Massarina eburnea CBS 473.64]|uniref:Uncharacterized protein n=1 Tax=Massarina eburnea CBS 473.64 TaxID=1395130 RepID=A0A6A6RTD0_9PLEO|nr:hypothetical protein P280DRAFT_482563 [Massarina eburnea CBS 473.64]